MLRLSQAGHLKYPANGHIILSTPGPLALEVNRYGYKILILLILWDLMLREE